MVIYKITNILNGKAYIGKTVNLNQRISAHKSCAKTGKGNLIHKAIKKYGIDSFKIEIIDGANSSSELTYRETFYINTHNTLVPNGYNLRDRDHKPTKNIKEKISAKAKSRYNKDRKHLKLITQIASQVNGIKIEAVNLDTKETIRLNSIRDAARLAGVSYTYMGNMLRGTKTLRPYNNYEFRFIERPTPVKPVKRIRCRPIRCIDVLTDEVRDFPSINSITKFGYSVKVVSRILGKKEARNGLIWEFCNE